MKWFTFINYGYLTFFLLSLLIVKTKKKKARLEATVQFHMIFCFSYKRNIHALQYKWLLCFT